MTDHFTQAPAGYVRALTPEGAPLFFRPIVNTVKDDEPGTVGLAIAGAASVIVQGSAAEYFEFLDPTPVEPEPPTDITGGKLRISDDGTCIALELGEGDPRGRWRVNVLISELQYYTNDADNPEIAGWAYLKVDTEA